MTTAHDTFDRVATALGDAHANDGSRPSLLELGRMAGGELPGPVPANYAAALHDIAADVPPFDFEVLRSRAWQVEPGDAIVVGPAPAPPVPGVFSRIAQQARGWWMGGAVLVLAAVAAMLVVDTGDQPYIGMKGPVHLDYFILQDGEVSTGDDGAVLREGDRIQFTYTANDNDLLVLLSVDGLDAITVFYPEHGDEPEHVQPGGPHLLEGSVSLDDAPGPEVFLAIFGTDDVATAERMAAQAHAEGGVPGLLRLAEDDPDIAAVVIDKADP